MPFLERLSEHLLGAAAQPAVARRVVAGRAGSTAFALAANLDLMIVRRCLGADREPIVVGMLNPAERKAFEAEIRAQPGQFVAQYPVTPSLSPDVGRHQPGAGCSGRARVFVERRRRRAIAVLPGGLAREPAGDTLLCARRAG